MRVSLSSLPAAPREYTLDFPRLDGGLNTWDLDYRLNANESPRMQNLWWQNGVLCSRDGQTFVTDEAVLGRGWSAYETLFWDNAFFHVGAKLYRAEMSAQAVRAGGLVLQEVLTGVPENRGTWFRYGDGLYYKNRGGYFEIFRREDGRFEASPVKTYAPIIQINTEPSSAAGDAYQPENRLNGQKTVWYTAAKSVALYHLPVTEVDSVDKVEVDGQVLTAGSGYSVDLTNGTVTFSTPPPVHEPVRANTVKITYTKANPEAYNSVMDCPYAAVYGGNQSICIVMGGCTAQPNAYFWCGNHIVMDPGYFPMEQYNLAGDTEERITGFGKQQSMLVIFKEASIGRTTMGLEKMASGRIMITMDYTPINSRIGCDLPWSIQLIENNLVFCNTSRGVHFLRDSSSALENNIESISRKVDNGLLPLIRQATSVCSHDDGSHYWLVADGQVYAWNYTLSGFSNPSWFYFTNINAEAFFTAGGSTYHLDASGRVTAMRPNYRDYGGPILKRYAFASQNMGGYDRLKDVLSCIFVVRSSADTHIRIFYETDYERREDLTPIHSNSWHLVPRDLSYRYLGIRRFATVVRRRPGCRHIRHFSMTLENNVAGMDMAVISAQVFYRYQGRDR